MMDTNLCNKTQICLLEGLDSHVLLPEECQKHLQECTECQAYAKTLALVCPPTIPAALDAETLRLAKAALPAGSAPWRRAWRRWALCAAGLAVLCGVAVFSTLQNSVPPEIKNPIVVRSLQPISSESADALKWDDMALTTNYAQANDDLFQMDLELDILLSELD